MMGYDLERVVTEMWKRPEVQAYVGRCRALGVGDAPTHNFVGFNLTRDRILTAKVNHHHFRRLDGRILDGLVPVRTVFDTVYPKWEPNQVRSSRETGAAFVIKVAPSGLPTYQFHFRFPFQVADFQRLGLAPHAIDLSNYTLNPGISFEYTGTEALRKLYYYLNRPEEKAIIADQFGEPWCQRADMLEYTQTDKARKVILWMYESPSCEEYFSQVNWPLLSELIQYMRGFGCEPAFPGIYEGGQIRAVYFFKFPVPNQSPWTLPENLQIRTWDAIPALNPQR